MHNADESGTNETGLSHIPLAVVIIGIGGRVEIVDDLGLNPSFLREQKYLFYYK